MKQIVNVYLNAEDVKVDGSLFEAGDLMIIHFVKEDKGYIALNLLEYIPGEKMPTVCQALYAGGDSKPLAELDIGPKDLVISTTVDVGE